MIPMRIQRSRKKGSRLPPNSVSVTRPGKWGNPYTIKKEKETYYIRDDVRSFAYRDTYAGAVRVALRSFGEYLEYHLSKSPEYLEPLRGKNLACYCRLCEAHKDGRPLGVECQDCDPCHVDVLLRLTNGR